MGSNPTRSATSLRTAYRSQRLFAKVASHSFCRSSSPNRIRLPGFDSVFCCSRGIRRYPPYALRTAYRSQRLFVKVASHSFCRSSSPNRIRLPGFDSGFLLQPRDSPVPAICAADGISFAATFCKSRFSLILSQLLPESNPLAGLRFGFFVAAAGVAGAPPGALISPFPKSAGRPPCPPACACTHRRVRAPAQTPARSRVGLCP